MPVFSAIVIKNKTELICERNAREHPYSDVILQLIEKKMFSSSICYRYNQDVYIFLKKSNNNEYLYIALATSETNTELIYRFLNEVEEKHLQTLTPLYDSTYSDQRREDFCSQVDLLIIYYNGDEGLTSSLRDSRREIIDVDEDTLRMIPDASATLERKESKLELSGKGQSVDNSRVNEVSQSPSKIINNKNNSKKIYIFIVILVLIILGLGLLFYFDRNIF